MVDEPIEEALCRVLDVAASCREFDDIRLKAVVKAKKVGATWEQLGEALGCTHQAAHSKYARYTNGTEGRG